MIATYIGRFEVMMIGVYVSLGDFPKPAVIFLDLLVSGDRVPCDKRKNSCVLQIIYLDFAVLPTVEEGRIDSPLPLLKVHLGDQ